MIDLARFDEGESGRTRLFDDPVTVRLDLDAGTSIPPHRHPERRVVVAVLDGTLEVTVGDATETVEEGRTARFPGSEDISLVAETDTLGILVLADA